MVFLTCRCHLSGKEQKHCKVNAFMQLGNLPCQRRRGFSVFPTDYNVNLVEISYYIKWISILGRSGSKQLTEILFCGFSGDQLAGVVTYQLFWVVKSPIVSTWQSDVFVVTWCARCPQCSTSVLRYFGLSYILRVKVQRYICWLFYDTFVSAAVRSTTINRSRCSGILIVFMLGTFVVLK